MEIVARELKCFPLGTILIHGDCRGADTIARLIGEELGFNIRSYPADWDAFHIAAGAIRNREMLKKENIPEEPIDLVLAFHQNIKESKGTKDMLRISSIAGVQFRLIIC